MLKFTASILHRYEIFDICNELNKFDNLKELYCSYPKYEVIKYGIPYDKINNYTRFEVLTRINDFFWRKNFYFSKYDFILTDSFDNHVSKKINQEFDVFYGSGGMCLNTYRVLKPNILKVYHSASMHINKKKKLMIEAGYNENEIIYDGMKRKYLQEIEEADLIVCSSNHTYESFLENNIPHNKVILNESGIDMSRFNYDSKYEKDDDYFKFLFVGNLSLRKGGMKLLNAYLKIRNKNTKLYIAGSIDFSLKNEFKKFSKYKDIIFLGKIKNSNLYKIYSECHLLCLFSSEEGFAKVLGESLACGLPILCSENSGGSHFINSKNQGSVIRNNDFDDIIEKMKFYSKRKDNIIKNKYDLSRYAKDNFSWKKSTANLVNKIKNFI